MHALCIKNSLTSLNATRKKYNFNNIVQIFNRIQNKSTINNSDSLLQREHKNLCVIHVFFMSLERDYE